jgi:hypothetical protein
VEAQGYRGNGRREDAAQDSHDLSAISTTGRTGNDTMARPQPDKMKAAEMIKARSV